VTGTIGLVAAMRQEVRPFLQAIAGVRVFRLGPFEAFSFELGGAACTLVRSGIGTRKAGEAISALLDAVAPRLIVSFGVSGAASNDLSVGDLVSIASCCLQDGGVLGTTMPLAGWPDSAREAARRSAAARGARMAHATAITTHGEKELPPGAAVNGAASLAMGIPTVDMETAAIVAPAAARGVPVLALRTISDTPRDPLPFEIGSVVDGEGRLRIAWLLAAAVRQPRLLLGLARTARNMRSAMGTLVPALRAALLELVHVLEQEGAFGESG
jgi:nucleoside phosphorylase